MLFRSGNYSFAGYTSGSNYTISPLALTVASIGAVNTTADGAIYFSITAGATPVVATDTLTFDGDRVLTGKAPVNCTYGLYDVPSQAQAGGATGRVTTTSGAYIRFAPSYALVVDNQGNPVANVESADPAYSEFVLGAPTFDILRGQIGGGVPTAPKTGCIRGGDVPSPFNTSAPKGQLERLIAIPGHLGLLGR